MHDPTRPDLNRDQQPDPVGAATTVPAGHLLGILRASHISATFLLPVSEPVFPVPERDADKQQQARFPRTVQALVSALVAFASDMSLDVQRRFSADSSVSTHYTFVTFCNISIT